MTDLPDPADRAVSMPGVRRQAVVVLSMHRSGSSVVTRTINLLGCTAPATLMPADASNEIGYWESEALRRFNERLLDSAGSHWRDWHAFNPRWYSSVRCAEALEEAQALFAQEYGAARLVVFKDPRVCRIFPFWQQTLEQAGYDLSVVIPVRNPLDVAASLGARNTMSATEAGLLWLRHVLDAEAESRHLPRGFVSYGAFVAAPVRTMTALQAPLGLEWPRLSPRVAAEIEAIVSPALRHHCTEVSDFSDMAALPEQIEQAYTILRRWAETGEDAADHDTLDTLRRSLNGVSGSLGLLVDTMSTQQAQLAQAEDRLAALTEAADSGAAEARKLASEKQTLTAELDKTRASAAQLRQDLDQARYSLDQMTAERAVLQAKAAKVPEQVKLLEERDQALDQQTGKTAQAETAVADLREAAAAAEAQRDRQEHELHTLRSTLAQRSHEADQYAESLAQARREAEEHAAALTALREEMARQAEELAQARQSAEARAEALEQLRHDTDQQIESLTDTLAGARREAAQTARALAEARRGAAQHDRQLDQLRREAEGRDKAQQSRIAELDRALGEQARRAAEARADSETQITTLDADLTTQAEELAKLAQLLMARDDALADKSAAVREARQQAEALRRTVHAEQAEKAALLAEIEVRGAALVQGDVARHAMLNSTSWKLTAPVRWLSTRLKRS